MKLTIYAKRRHFSIFYEEIGGEKSWNGKVWKKMMIRVQFMCFVFNFFRHLSKNHPPGGLFCKIYAQKLHELMSEYLIYITDILFRKWLVSCVRTWVVINPSEPPVQDAMLYNIAPENAKKRTGILIRKIFKILIYKWNVLHLSPTLLDTSRDYPINKIGSRIVV